MSARTQLAIKLLENAESHLDSQRGLIGLDGFVDQILRVVDKKQSDGTATFIPKIPDWGVRVQAAGGKSTKFELSVQAVKLGGNGVIMANALATYSLPLTCIGNLGYPDIHPVFHPMKSVCKLITIADASYTDAVEFEDGKIMLSRQEASALVTWETMERVVGRDVLFHLFNDSTFIALNNWTALPHMSDIWKQIQENVCPKLSKLPARRNIFFDLADPEFRLAEDIRKALDLIAKFQNWFDVTLGLNLKEAGEICEVLGLKVGGKDREFTQKSAEAIRTKLSIDGVVVHATAYAAAASPKDSQIVDGPYVEKPLISTGAGDHFNAGYSLGTILGGSLEQRLQLGVATSGFYVRTAKSPTVKDIRGFLAEIG